MCLIRVAKPEIWHQDAADIMAREGKTLKEAVTDLGIALTSNEVANIVRRHSFQDMVRKAKNSFGSEVGSDPGLSKEKTIGQLQLLADKLERDGAYDKAAEVLFKLSKLKNWVGEGGVVNVFSGLSQTDIDEMRKKIVTEKQPELAVN